AAGWTSNEGGGISYNIPYAKNIGLEDTIKYWQYCDRLVGYYAEHGVEIIRGCQHVKGSGLRYCHYLPYPV
ncbi:MAG: hypothetical protein R6V54_11390, partial [Desulfobacteraceae bacterium]